MYRQLNYEHIYIYIYRRQKLQNNIAIIIVIKLVGNRETHPFDLLYSHVAFSRFYSVCVRVSLCRSVRLIIKFAITICFCFYYFQVYIFFISIAEMIYKYYYCVLGIALYLYMAIIIIYRSII